MDAQRRRRPSEIRREQVPVSRRDGCVAGSGAASVEISRGWRCTRRARRPAARRRSNAAFDRTSASFGPDGYLYRGAALLDVPHRRRSGSIAANRFLLRVTDSGVAGTGNPTGFSVCRQCPRRCRSRWRGPRRRRAMDPDAGARRTRTRSRRPGQPDSGHRLYPASVPVAMQIATRRRPAGALHHRYAR